MSSLIVGNKETQLSTDHVIRDYWVTISSLWDEEGHEQHLGRDR